MEKKNASEGFFHSIRTIFLFYIYIHKKALCKEEIPSVYKRLNTH